MAEGVASAAGEETIEQEETDKEKVAAEGDNEL
jgi:hypothetical protein